VPYLLKKFPASYGKIVFIAAYKSALYQAPHEAFSHPYILPPQYLSQYNVYLIQHSMTARTLKEAYSKMYLDEYATLRGHHRL
jgi:hypothetical protein